MQLHGIQPLTATAESGAPSATRRSDYEDQIDAITMGRPGRVAIRGLQTRGSAPGADGRHQFASEQCSGAEHDAYASSTCTGAQVSKRRILDGHPYGWPWRGSRLDCYAHVVGQSAVS